MASEMTSLGADRATADAIRELADQYGVKMPRALAAIEAGWRMLSDEQKRDAMFLVADAAQPTTEQQESSKPAVDSVQICQVPAAKQVQDMTSEDDAGPKTTTGEPRNRVNDDEALSPTG